MSTISRIRSLRQVPGAGNPNAVATGANGATEPPGAMPNPGASVFDPPANEAPENPPSTAPAVHAAPATPNTPATVPAASTPAAGETATPQAAATSNTSDGSHPCEWFEDDVPGNGCRGSAEYFISVGGFKCLEDTALPEYLQCLDSQGERGCENDAPEFCATKALVSGPPACGRAVSILSRESLQLVEGVTTLTISEDCNHTSTLENTASRECENLYDALYEVTGCCSCENDKSVFTGEVMSTCASKRQQAACETASTKQEVDEIICNIMEPADSLGCTDTASDSSGGLSNVAVGGIVGAVVLCAIAAAVAFLWYARGRKRSRHNGDLDGHSSTNHSANEGGTLKTHDPAAQSPFVSGNNTPPVPPLFAGHFSAPIYSQKSGGGSGAGGMHPSNSEPNVLNPRPSLAQAYQTLNISSRQQFTDDVQLGNPMMSAHQSSGNGSFFQGSGVPPALCQMGSIKSSVDLHGVVMTPGSVGLFKDGSMMSVESSMHGAHGLGPSSLQSASQMSSMGKSSARWGGIPAEFIKVTRVPEMPGGFTVCTNDNDTFANTRVDATSLANNLSTDASKTDILEAQLDYLQARGDGAIFNFLKLAPFLGRRMGGQGAVAFAHHRDCAANLYAVKFFFSRKGFDVEKEAACNETLRALMPPVATIEDDACTLAAATSHMPAPLCEHTLPPAIVTEKGESLDEFVARSAPDRFTALQVMVHIARKLEQLHAAGFVHRDLKPGNAIWLPSQNSWTLIDFGCAARSGSKADLNFSLYYAPPEVVIAFKDGKKDMDVLPSIDVWSLGVICWELLTKHKFYGSGATVRTDAVVAMLRGEKKLPTEEQLPEDLSQTLGSSALRESILSMLHRDPQQRPCIESLLATWTQMF